MGQPITFAEWLRGELDQREWGVRTLARRIDPLDPEVPRRALNRYLRGSMPTEANRQAIARGLGIDVADMPSRGPQEVGLQAGTFRRGSRGDVLESDGTGGGASRRASASSAESADGVNGAVCVGPVAFPGAAGPTEPATNDETAANPAKAARRSQTGGK